MKTNLLVLIQNEEQYEICKGEGVSHFLFPLQNFCVGFEQEYSIEELSSFEGNIYLYINRILDHEAITKLECILHNLPSYIKGIFYEDIGVFELKRELGLSIPFYAMTSHFGTSALEIRYWTEEGVSGVLVGTELTEEEITSIVSTCKGKVIVPVFGYLPVLYSRRTLLTNYAKNFDLEEKKERELTEPHSNKHFFGIENEYGMVLYHKPMFEALHLVSTLENACFFYINGLGVSAEDLQKVFRVINGSTETFSDVDCGFLHTKTIYKIKEQPRDGKN